MTDAVIEVTGLTKFFGRQRVLHEVGLTVRQGETCALLGRNGTGKTTLIRILLGLDRPTRGRTAVFGCDSQRLGRAVKRRVGYVAEGHKLLGHLSVAALAALNRGLTGRFNDHFFDHLIGRLKLPSDRKVGRLSNGQRAQLALALALASEPELLIMDDPTLGLDTVLRREFLELAIDLIQREGRSILITSHILSDVERLADHIAILRDQRIVVDCALEALKTAVQKLRLTWPDEPPTELPVRGLITGRRRGREWLITMAGVNEQRMAALRSLGPQRIEPVPMSLEEIFVEYVGNESQVGGGMPCGS